MERYCGMLGPLVHSRLYPYRSLTNSALLLERLRYIDLTYESYALDSSDSQPAANENGNFAGTVQQTMLTSAEQRVFRDGYERILSVQDASRVCQLYPELIYVR
jgi:hypothetical protein